MEAKTDNKKPILFNTEMVKAILEGRKVQTRRVIKGRFNICFDHTGAICDIQKKDDNDNHIGTIYPPYQPGDILWVRETWAEYWYPDRVAGYVYKADGEPMSYVSWGNSKTGKDEVWMPSIHMPKDAARIFLKVTNVRAERLQDITEDDAKAEGAGKAYYIRDAVYHNFEDKDNFRDGFRELWDSCYNWPKTWNANPWVWVITFEKVKKEI